ncbi:MAG: Flavin-dependent thymidylate synthase [Nitrosomonadaceae bacterium]|nr:Flavin-dependent thymidylate synthase [Nitrosomonadaceae bacterium]
MEIELVLPDASLITCTPDAERHIELCGREAYGSAPSQNIEDTRAWISKRISGWEHDVLEHASATFHITCSRVVSHELVRHRIASYTQSSQRFTEDATKQFIVPPELKGEDREEFILDLETMHATYEKWRAHYPRQTARYLLPNATATTIMMTMNFRELRHLIVMRAAKMAQPEMQLIARLIWTMCMSYWPSVFDDLTVELDKRGWNA